MSLFDVRPLKTMEFPPLLAEIPTPPKELWAVGRIPPLELKLLTVVGSRQYTTYGKQVVEKLIGDLVGYPIGIVSGLALGIDGLAHEAALKAKLYTVAVPGSGLDESVLYPASHRQLARKIIENGGGLISELPPEAKAALWTFPQRNRLMAGMSQATLLIEASEKSGTLITARMTVDYNRELLVVPGSIFSKNSLGTHQFLKLGATPITRAEDILSVLGIDQTVAQKTQSFVPLFDLSPLEKQIIKLLFEPTDRDTLIRRLGQPSHLVNPILMEMEMKDLIISENNIYRAIL